MCGKIVKLTERGLKEIIKEELGISFELSKIALNVYNDIISNIESVDGDNNGSCIIKRGNVNCAIRDINFDITYTYRNFFDFNIANSIGQNQLTGGYSCFLNKNFILCNIDILAISGNINKKMALYTIQHELEHIYQEILSNKRIPGDDMLYAKMRTDMECGNELRYYASRLVYCCFKSEQEGFINGTYAWCMADDIKTEPYNYNTIKDSPVGLLYDEMKTLYDKATIDDELQTILKNDYNLSLNDIYLMIRNLGKRIGRLLIKVNNDKSKIWRI